MQPSTDTLFKLSITRPPPALSSAKHILLLFFSPPSDYLHEDLHLNGCGKHINNTYTKRVKTVLHLLLSDMNGKKKSMTVL